MHNTLKVQHHLVNNLVQHLFGQGNYRTYCTSALPETLTPTPTPSPSEPYLNPILTLSFWGTRGRQGGSAVPSRLSLYLCVVFFNVPVRGRFRFVLRAQHTFIHASISLNHTTSTHPAPGLTCLVIDHPRQAQHSAISPAQRSKTRRTCRS